MQIAIVTENIGTEFAKGIADVLKTWGHDVIRTDHPSPKRINISLDINGDSPLSKVDQFQRFEACGIACPPNTTSRMEAAGWLMEEGLVFCRTLTKANSGRGIVQATNPEELVDAPLYTRYIKKRKEYRVHVFYDKVIRVQEKRLRADFPKESVNHQVRNFDNGWVFCTQDLNIANEQDLHTLARDAVGAVGYLFGAVDIIFNEHHNKYYVLEVNSRPGIEGGTAEVYATEIIKWCEANGDLIVSSNTARIKALRKQFVDLINQLPQTAAAAAQPEVQEEEEEVNEDEE